MRNSRRVLAKLLGSLVCMGSLSSCTEKEPDKGGLMLIVSQESGPQVDRLQMRVTQVGEVLLDRPYQVPEDATLPTTLAIASNGDPKTSVNVAVSGWHGDTLIDHQNAIITQVPTNRVAEVRIVLSASCSSLAVVEKGVGQSKCDDGSGKQTCDRATGLCVSANVDGSDLGDYQSGSETGSGGSSSGSGGASGTGGDTPTGTGGDAATTVKLTIEPHDADSTHFVAGAAKKTFTAELSDSQGKPVDLEGQFINWSLSSDDAGRLVGADDGESVVYEPPATLSGPDAVQTTLTLEVNAMHASVDIEVLPHAPAIDAFTSDVLLLRHEQTKNAAVLSWETSEPLSSLEIEGSDGSKYSAKAADFSSGSHSVTPLETTRYTLTATNARSTVKKSVTVHVVRPNASTIAASKGFTVIDENGKVVTWGDGEPGRIGSFKTPTAVDGPSDVTSVGMGWNTTFAMAANGQVWGWGRNSNNQLAPGDTTKKATPVVLAVPANTLFVAGGGVLAGNGGDYSEALTGAGTVYSWGLASNLGQLGQGAVTGTVQNPTQISGLASITELAVGSFHSLALDASGAVWQWGSDSSGAGNRTTPVKMTQAGNGNMPTLGGVVAVAAGGGLSLALLKDGSVMAWGDGARGQIGINTTSNQPKPVKVHNLSNVVAITAGYYETGVNVAPDLSFAYAITSDGTVWGWGYGAYGLMGATSTTDILEPQVIPGVPKVVAIAAGNRIALVLTPEGDVWNWGLNKQINTGEQGSLGRGVTGDSTNVPGKAYSGVKVP